jgi:CheY-like chemotaxis protein/anti-sigma regulatory factor (Ser/Thr protein kinase)
MTHILVAEDSATQRAEIEILLEDSGFEVTTAVNGLEALNSMQEFIPDIVLTYLHMPEMDGLELVEAVRRDFPGVPVIVITADGTEELAARALKSGASSYIPKKLLEKDLLPALNDIVEVLESKRNEERLSAAIVSTEVTYRISNNHHLTSALIGRLEQQLKEHRFGDDTGVFRILMGIKEAIMNAIDHGNLELDSGLRDLDDNSYRLMGEERQKIEPYCSRTVRVKATVTAEEARYVVTDEGPGFSPDQIPDPTDPENLLRPHGRGMMLIQSFLDSVSHNEVGNEITMIKRFDGDS